MIYLFICPCQERVSQKNKQTNKVDSFKNKDTITSRHIRRPCYKYIFMPLTFNQADGVSIGRLYPYFLSSGLFDLL